MNLNQWVDSYLGIRSCIREMAQSPDPQVFRGHPRPKPQGGKQSNRQKVETMLANMEPAPLPDNPSDADIAAHLGVSVQQLREVMGGRSVEQMAASLDTTPAELIDVLETMLRQMTKPATPGEVMPLKVAMTKLKSYGVKAMAKLVKAREQRADLLAGRGKIGAMHREAVKAMTAKARKLRGC